LNVILRCERNKVSRDLEVSKLINFFSFLFDSRNVSREPSEKMFKGALDYGKGTQPFMMWK